MILFFMKLFKTLVVYYKQFFDNVIMQSVTHLFISVIAATALWSCRKWTYVSADNLTATLN